MAVNREQVRRVAEIGAKVIELQLSAAERTAEVAFCHRWAIGYCFGALEALGQHYRMDTVETAALITVGFDELLVDDDAQKRYARAVQLQTDVTFAEGRTHGSDDFSRFVTGGGFRPLMLMNYLMFGKPAAL